MKKYRILLLIFIVQTIIWIAAICIVVSCVKKNNAVQSEPEALSKVLLYGNPPKAVLVKENLGEFVLTAYCPCVECSEGYGDLTATGKRAVEGRTIAVDPKIIPYGTEIYIDGVGYRTAEDCGGLVKGKHIDIYFDCHSKVDVFGKKYAEVEI